MEIDGRPDYGFLLFLFPIVYGIGCVGIEAGVAGDKIRGDRIFLGIIFYVLERLAYPFH